MIIDADLQLSGPIAQLGRTGVINETATILIGQFVKNVEARLALAGREASSVKIEQPLTSLLPTVQGINAGTMIWLVLKSLFRKLIRKS